MELLNNMVEIDQLPGSKFRRSELVDGIFGKIINWEILLKTLEETKPLPEKILPLDLFH